MSTVPRIALACTLALLPGLSLAADPQPPSFASLIGRWKAVKILAVGQITASDKQGRAGIGTMVTISADRISDTHEPSAICEPHNPTVSFENTDSKLDQDFGTRIGDIRLPHGTLKARMPFFAAGCAGALVINANEMMWPLGNGFFYLIRRVQG